ncbi:MAG: hypothetical protein ACFFD2_02550 [Promethearchaeota archaeon]
MKYNAIREPINTKIKNINIYNNPIINPRISPALLPSIPNILAKITNIKIARFQNHGIVPMNITVPTKHAIKTKILAAREITPPIILDAFISLFYLFSFYNFSIEN